MVMVWFSPNAKLPVVSRLHHPTIVQVILIFHPDSTNLVDRELMANLQDKYINLLKHYLEAEFSFEFAQEYFVAILEKMSVLKSLSDQHSRILLQVNPSQIEPLMLEVLNLKWSARWGVCQATKLVIPLCQLKRLAFETSATTWSARTASCEVNHWNAC